MSPWGHGAHDVQQLIDDRALSRLQGADGGVRALLMRSRQQLASASKLVDSDPDTAVVVAYDAAKHAGLALLAVQNLRPTASGGHVAIEKALLAQFQGVFAGFNALRRRRHELDYPSGEGDFADVEEARRAIESASRIVEDAQRLVDQGVLTTF